MVDGEEVAVVVVVMVMVMVVVVVVMVVVVVAAAPSAAILPHLMPLVRDSCNSTQSMQFTLEHT